MIRTAPAELKVGEGREILNVQQPGTVSQIVIEGDASAEFLRQVEIEMLWDESPRANVVAPLGMFFASAVRPENVRSLPTKVELLPEHRIRLTSYFRMPFWRRGYIALANRPSPAPSRLARSAPRCISCRNATPKPTPATFPPCISPVEPKWPAIG